MSFVPVKVFYCHHFVLPLPAGHRFPMAKYRRLYERVGEHADALGIELREPAAADDTALLRVHSADYLARLAAGALTATEQRRLGFPWSPAMVERARRSVGGTLAALEAALRGERIAVNLAGGTHHAHRDHGRGYCVFNDAVVAARHVQALGLARHVLIVDLDVHQGNGTAALVRDDPSIFAFSMHDARNYPALKEPGDLDVAVPEGCDDRRYLDLLARYLPEAIARAQADAAIYLAGADPFAGDTLGQMLLSKAGLRQRDRTVLEALAHAALPCAIAMAGGYAEDVEDIVDIHFGTVSEAAMRWAADAAQSGNAAVSSGR